MSEKTSRERTAADLRILEPDMVGALAVVLHGRGPRTKPEPSPRRPPAGWRGVGGRLR